MKTSKNISSISYNTDEFLKLKLDELIEGKIITYYMFINHKPEEDEKKEHKHLFIIPAKMVQTDDIRQELLEPFTELDNSKPLGTMPFVNAKTDDWLLYAIHDKHYLATKGQTRKYHYKWEDIKASDEDYKNILIQEISITVTPYDKIQSARISGQNFYEFIASGQVPIRDITYYEKAWQSFDMIKSQQDEKILNDRLNRNGKSNHETIVTGICTKCGKAFYIDELEEKYTDLRGTIRGVCKNCIEKNKLK